MPMTKEYFREYNRRKHEEAKPAYEALMSCYPLTLDDLDGEEWKPIEGFDKYQISTFGRVKSFWQRRAGKILKPSLVAQGYLNVDLYKCGEKKHCRVHVLVAEAFIPNPEGKPEVNHDDGNKFNCHISNLYWATSAENKQHAYDTGLKSVPQGTEHWRAKIKDEKNIIYIRENPDNLTTIELAATFGVKQNTISQIQLGKTHTDTGGTIRESKVKRVPDEIRAAIRADWATGNFTKSQLARKFGVSEATIRNIIHEK